MFFLYVWAAKETIVSLVLLGLKASVNKSTENSYSQFLSHFLCYTRPSNNQAIKQNKVNVIIIDFNPRLDYNDNTDMD